jgi:hypothetical protein
VCSGTSAQSASGKRGLQRVTVCHPQHPNDDSPRSLLVLLHTELAILKRELVGDVLVKHQGEDLLEKPPIRVSLHVLAAVDEDVVLPRMSVHITVQRH